MSKKYLDGFGRILENDSYEMGWYQDSYLHGFGHRFVLKCSPYQLNYFPEKTDGVEQIGLFEEFYFEDVVEITYNKEE